MFKKIKDKYIGICQHIHAAFKNPDNKAVQLGLFVFGTTLLSLGFTDLAHAQATEFDIEDSGFVAITCAIIEFVEGPFGAFIMVVAGLGAIVAASFAQYRAALGAIIVAAGAFILRSLAETFFPETIEQCTA